MTILQQILDHKKVEIDQRRKIVTIPTLQQAPAFRRTCNSARQAFSGKAGVIAEFKRKSPSKGYFNQQADAAAVCRSYASAGALAVSVLTDNNFFGGSLQDLEAVRSCLDIPILRKDFMISEYQFYESKAFGADFILLIAAALEPVQVKDFSALAKELGMEVLLEVHSPHEIDTHLCGDIDLLGVNNRNLKTFVTDLTLSKQMIKDIPDQFVPISESGIDSPDAVLELIAMGYKGFLIGESFMKQPEPGVACESFIKALR